MGKTKYAFLLCSSAILLLLVAGCERNRAAFNPSMDQSETPAEPDTAKVVYAGVRSSSYGIDPFPEPAEWRAAMEIMSGYFTGSKPCAIWIVGEIWGSDCHLFFPSDGRAHPNVSFQNLDDHERFLSDFDFHGIRVFLQVEPSDADMGILVDLVMNRYKHHPCVVGFGVDVEWYRETSHPGWGAKVPNDTARAWEARVKRHGSDYRLFLKHWDHGWMPQQYRGDIVFVNDSQGFPNLQSMVNEFKNWGRFFRPNRVFFQIGYEADQNWWGRLTCPPETMGKAIADQIEQQCGIFWVDFTLSDVLPAS